MTVQIQDELDREPFLYSTDLFFYMKKLGKLPWIFSVPASIKVISIGIPTIVPQHDSIDIHHRDTIDVESPEQKFILCSNFGQLG